MSWIVSVIGLALSADSANNANEDADKAKKKTDKAIKYEQDRWRETFQPLEEGMVRDVKRPLEEQDTYQPMMDATNAGTAAAVAKAKTPGMKADQALVGSLSPAALKADLAQSLLQRRLQAITVGKSLSPYGLMAPIQSQIERAAQARDDDAALSAGNTASNLMQLWLLNQQKKEGGY